MIKRLSHKDLVLLAGIVVAIIIALTTLVYQERPAEAQTAMPVKPAETSSLSSPASVVRHLLEEVVHVTFAQTSSTAR